MASNGYDILLLEAQDRLSSNDLEGTFGGHLELWEFYFLNRLMGGNGGCDGLDLFDLMADVVPNPNMARQRATSGMPPVECQSACHAKMHACPR